MAPRLVSQHAKAKSKKHQLPFVSNPQDTISPSFRLGQLQQSCTTQTHEHVPYLACVVQSRPASSLSLSFYTYAGGGSTSSSSS